MSVYSTLITISCFYLPFFSIGQKENDNEFQAENLIEVVEARPIESVKDQSINFVNVYPNELMESFVIDVHDRDFDQLTVIVKDETGKTIYASYLQQVQAGEFKEFTLPKALDREVLYVIIKAGPEELIQIFNT